MRDMDLGPWRSKQGIEQAAANLLQTAGYTLGREMTPPIPVETIIEKVLGIHLLVEDLTELYPELPFADDMLGATLVKQKQIVIHTKLLADPRNQGRYYYTCAHELGHWLLHRHLFHASPTSTGNESCPDDILCRLSYNRKRGEWQADYMAACLLMPEARVKDAWRQAVSDQPLVLVNREGSLCRGGKPIWLEPVLSHVPFFSQNVIEAGQFSNVSKTAMSIRLQELGLLINAVDKPWLWVQ